MSKVIVIAAHPDDETLGCGGTLLKHKAAGDEIAWLITTGVSEKSGFSAERVASRADEISRVQSYYDMTKVYQLNYPTTRLSDGDLIEMIPAVAKIFKEFEPEIVYILNRSDAHSDHLITFKATMACTKSFRHPYVKKVLMYECISETEFGHGLPEEVFIPNYFVDITDYLEDKLSIMKIYASELGAHPFPRSLDNIRALAHFRGATAGVQYAEAFQLLKYIDK